ncbi:MAG: DNA-binding protein [Flavobacteriales bacterium]|nr:DNA-binding protein [Flavobacteriales bacterium]|tara:strand:+ start:36933 stop:37352 length:420 start_codon:yes stop_codon:yes gene_type:complete
MEESEKGNAKRRDDIYSKSLRAGNRTYFFDVKSTKSEELYLTITESKRRFNNDNGKFFYEKHKLFLYPEDFASFKEFFEETLEKIYEMNDGKEIIPREELEAQRKEDDESHDDDDKDSSSSNFSDVNFDDLGSEDKAKD